MLFLTLYLYSYKGKLMSKGIRFFREFLKERKTVGAVSPSSIFLARKMVAPIDFNKARIIVELGPGTGIFTKEILKYMHADAKLFVFETQKSFCDVLEKEINDPRMILINDSAEKILEYLQQHGFEKADYTVSSLPFTVIPSQVKNTILNQAVKCLKPGGLFIQFQYTLNAHKLLKSYFRNVKLDFTPMNIPPAFIYKCSI
jgi:phosphatidylethanolamine/phosphatidyl-N-methylethanolamine N-methyltransferase